MDSSTLQRSSLCESLRVAICSTIVVIICESNGICGCMRVRICYSILVNEFEERFARIFYSPYNNVNFYFN